MYQKIKPVIDILPFTLREYTKYALLYPFSHHVEKPKLPENCVKFLKEQFEPDIEELKKLTNYEYKEWNL